MAIVALSPGQMCAGRMVIDLFPNQKRVGMVTVVRSPGPISAAMAIVLVLNDERGQLPRLQR